MFLPIGDSPNPPHYRAWVTWGLMAVNIAVYLGLTLPLSLQAVTLDTPMLQDYLRHLAPQALGMRPEQVIQHLNPWDLFMFGHGYQPGAPSAVDLFTAMFMHAGFMHLAGNMLFLWIYGNNVEHRLGRSLYLAAYLGTGAIATLCFGAFAGDSLTPLVGASGAISGVLGCYFLLFPKNRVKVFVFFFPFLVTTWMLPARIVLGIFLVIDNFLPALFGSGGGVAYGAHIGGFAGGLALAYVGERFGWTLRRSTIPRKSGPAKSSTPFVSVSDAEGTLRSAIRNKSRSEALRQVRLLAPGQILEFLGPETVTIAEWLADSGDPILAMTLLRRTLTLPRGEVDQAKVYLTLGLVRLQQGQPTAAYQHLVAVFDHDPDEHTETRARSALIGIAPN